MFIFIYRINASIEITYPNAAFGMLLSSYVYVYIAFTVGVTLLQSHAARIDYALTQVCIYIIYIIYIYIIFI